MQGETGSLRDLKRYHYRDNLVPNHNNKIIEENSGDDNADQESNDSAGSESEPDQEHNNVDHIARLREFQFKILSSSNNPICNPSQPRSGRRHTLCLTR